MAKAAGSIRLLLAGVFLLARMALGFATPVPPCPAAAQLSPVVHSASVHATAATSAHDPGDASRSPPATVPCCCGSGLSGTALGVLPSPLPVERRAASDLVFATDRGSDVVGVRASPALPPPRS